MVVSTLFAWLLVNPIFLMTDCPCDAQPPRVWTPPPLLGPVGLTSQARPLPCLQARAVGQTQCVAEAGPMVTRVYQVADLVVPMPGTPTPASMTTAVIPPPCPSPCVAGTCPPAQHTTEARLMALIRTQVAPASWADKGGPAAIDYYPVGMSLIVRQSAVCHEQIAELLQSLRRTQDTQVAVEVRLIAVPDGVTTLQSIVSTAPQCEATPKTACAHACGNPATENPVFLDDKGLHSFLDTAMADRRTNVLMMPKLTVVNGQDATIAATEQHWFVVDVAEKRKNDQVPYEPHNQAFTTGMTFQVQPVVSADRRYVKMKLSVQDTELAVEPVPMTPITTFVTPVFEGGSQGQPIPFTQYVQRPTFEHHQLDRTLTVPDGHTVLLMGWKQKCPARPALPEVLRDLPFLSCFLLNACPAGPDTERVLVLVTPRVLPHEEAELNRPTRTADAYTKASPITQAVYEEPPQTPAASPLQEILAHYQAACARGDRAAATQWAVQALAIEPTCFATTGR